jgi:D-threo-aldose 1-dehydrogenase
MAEIGTSAVGSSGLAVTRLGLGTAPLGDLFQAVGDDGAAQVLSTAVDAGVTLLDTAPYYGLGLSEHRVGRYVRSLERRDDVVVATKVGRLLAPVPRGREREDTFWAGGLRFDPRFDYGYDAIMRSYEDSLQRLGLDRVEMLAIHDLDVDHFDGDAFDGRLRELEHGVRALEELRSSGEVQAIGLGINALGSIPRVLELIELDYAIVAMPYTLLDQDALDEELPLCLERGVRVVIGAVFASGLLADDAGAGTYGYTAPPTPVASRAAAMRTVCARHGVSLAAAALQFPFGHPAVAAVIPGALTAEQVRENVQRFAAPVPAVVWEELKAEDLLRADAPVP